MLPDSYPSPQHLPFNATCLEEKFRLMPPDRDPGGEGLWLALRGTELLLRQTGEGFSLPQGELPSFLDATRGPPFFLGTWQGRPCRALRLPREQDLPEGFVVENLLAAEPRIGIGLLTLAGTAGMALHWERGSRHCSHCGGAMERLPDEWGKKCLACGYGHFPHIHPCIIVLVRRQGKILLTRKASWPEGRYSLVAGFIDFGECLEEATAREVREETGVEVREIRYVGSQCWPFPSQLMAGFVAEHAGGEVRVDEKELEDARWFPVDRLPLTPPRRSIARYLIDTYGRGV